MALAAGLPIAALAAPGLLAASANRLAASRAGRALGAAALRPLSLVATLALVPPALVFAVALWFPLLQSRLFLVFTPYLLVLAAAGAAVIARTRRLAVALAVGLLAVHAGSAALAPGRLSTPREYKRLGADLERAYRPGDLVFARHRHWATTPLFYYLDRSRAALVTRHFGRALREHRAPRVFVVIPFRDGRMHRAMRHALAGYEMVGVLRRLNNRVEIYAPAARAAAPGEE